MKQLDRWLSLGLILTLGFLLGILGFSVWDKMPSTVERIAWSPEAQWIAPQEPSYRFYVRRTFYVADTVQAGWLRLSADNSFILYVNGQEIAQNLSVFSHPLNLAADLSEPFQNFNDSIGYRDNGIENYQFANTRQWKLTVYIDLTNYLRPGKNVIALEIQKGRENPRLVVQGAVYTVPGAAPIDLTTGATPWKFSTLSEKRQGLLWFERNFPDESWLDADAISPVREATYSRLSQHLFNRLLQGTWIAGNESPDGEVWLRGDWQVPETRQRAFIRFAGDGEYALLIDGLLVKRFRSNASNHLHMYEVTNFLKTGHNTLAVRLSRPLDLDSTATQKGSLGFFLDGWVETAQNNITAPITTDSSWSTLTGPIPGWAEGSGQGQPATILRAPISQEFQRRFEGNAYLLNYPNYLWHNSLWCLLSIGCSLVSAWFLGRFWLNRRNGWWDSFGSGAGLLLPGTLFLIGIGLLKHRYAQAELGLLFAQPQSNPLILLGFVEIVLLTLVWSQICRSPQNKLSSGLEICSRWGLWFLVGLITCVSSIVAGSLSTVLVCLGFCEIVVLILLFNRGRWSFRHWFKAILQTWPSWSQWFFVVLIVAVGFALRAYNLGFADLDADENTSLDATRGILRTVAPVTSSGIWYTRGPVYQYMLALWLWLIGYSENNARFLSVICGTATLVLVFILTRKITGKVWIALVVTALLCIDPWEIFYSRNIRYYQLLQLINIWGLWLFLKGFIERSWRGYQYMFFMALASELVTQEVTVVLLPGYLIGFLCFYRPFSLLVEWPIVVGSLMTIVIYIYDGIFFSIKCLTPLVALSGGTATPLKPHLLDVTGFISTFFFGYSRLYTIYSFFFFIGLVYFLKKRNKKIVFLFSIVFFNIAFLTTLLLIINPRYIYYTYPLFILLSVYSAVCIMESVGRNFESILNGLLPLRNIALCFVVLLLLSNIEPGKVLASYHDAINKRDTQVFEYIRARRQPGDVVIANTPTTSAIVLGGLDYFLPHQAIALLDVLYSHEGRLIDRWGGGVEITNLDQMSHILEKANRVWIQLDDPKPKTNSPEAAQFIDYFQTLGQPVLEPFGVRLRLWQRSDGELTRIPNQGQDLGDY